MDKDVGLRQSRLSWPKQALELSLSGDSARSRTKLAGTRPSIELNAKIDQVDQWCQPGSLPSSSSSYSMKKRSGTIFRRGMASGRAVIYAPEKQLFVTHPYKTEIIDLTDDG
ncbi:hypothetical protein P3T76_004953 [Phytophthora citrophthora]|uniref:Uncharacterized protein n=1 Tax=Phytophthora citrophthora TaxID=4793 RepID=A0AAD9GRV1_9STRA|nr:hypothetical protein P3T76_004953 [Phytophthora citrophthora]